MRILRESDARVRPWRNGRGVTQELAIWPENATLERGDFAYRISRASIVEDGAFSEFPGCDRVLVVLDGDGVELHHGGGQAGHVLRARTPYAFSGDDRTEARLLGAPVVDFNVIVARERARALACELVTRNAVLATSGNHLFCHVVLGAFQVAPVGTLSASESAWWIGSELPASLALTALDPESMAIVIDLASR